MSPMSKTNLDVDAGVVFRDTTILGEKYGVEWGKGIPIPTTWRLWGFDVDEPNVLFPFRELIGALLWIALLTRPDIAYAMRTSSWEFLLRRGR